MSSSEDFPKDCSSNTSLSVFPIFKAFRTSLLQQLPRGCMRAQISVNVSVQSQMSILPHNVNYIGIGIILLNVLLSLKLHI